MNMSALLIGWLVLYGLVAYMIIGIIFVMAIAIWRQTEK